MLPALGTASIGIVVGWLVRYFIRRFETFTPQSLGTVISILSGGALVYWLGPTTEPTHVWFYPIGLLIAFFGHALVAYLVSSRRDLTPEERHKLYELLLLGKEEDRNVLR